MSDRRLAIEIEAIWECSDRTYGAPRVHRWLCKQGFVVGHNRVARIMAANGWEDERPGAARFAPRSSTEAPQQPPIG